jgi:excisionase family DNA binding protein
MVLAMKSREQRRTNMTTAVEEGWLTYGQAQLYTALGRTTLWTLLNTGAIEGAKVGRSVRISRCSLDAYMRRNSCAGSKAGREQP